MDASPSHATHPEGSTAPGPTRPGGRQRRRVTRSIVAGLIAVAAVGGTLAGVSNAEAATNHTVTFVNLTGERIWVGSTVNTDGSGDLGNLPILDPGQSDTVTIPENAAPGYWRGKFFARQRCSGVSGSTFHCDVGDCGNLADRCVTNQEQPASLAEFNFDSTDQWGAPWYDVSYVNAVSVPITINPTGAAPPPPGSSGCAQAGCPEPLIDACPAPFLRSDETGVPLVCVNPDRDAVTAYSEAIINRCPLAYAWSKQDTVPGNQTVFNCPTCGGFTVTFHHN